MRITVTQFNANDLDTAWPALVDHCTEHAPDLVVLPELPFGPWLSATADVDPAAWAESERLRGAWFGSRSW